MTQHRYPKGYVVKEFKTAGSYTLTVPSGVSYIDVLCIGGGGGGGGTQTASVLVNNSATYRAGGGSGGNMVSALGVPVDRSTSGLTPATLTVVVGAGGTGGVGVSGGDGGSTYVSNYGTSYAFDVDITAYGGKGGVGAAASTGAGGAVAPAMFSTNPPGRWYLAGANGSAGQTTPSNMTGVTSASYRPPLFYGTIPHATRVGTPGWIGGGSGGRSGNTSYYTCGNGAGAGGAVGSPPNNTPATSDGENAADNSGAGGGGGVGTLFVTSGGPLTLPATTGGTGGSGFVAIGYWLP